MGYGQRCGDPRILLLALLLMPYAVVRYGIDAARKTPPRPKAAGEGRKS
ncbi:hypothetical protein [Paractinoplanes atraurantiacus]|uniref:Uncharacterized protein n=1 Tax=Paractinoplanes atraurantiacus TaxID=1036182 RepID=A0A285GZL9_9ACTN|nr:hypothetical protein [Actinoplanes atraurantiacus]SNY28947.1 hypothetical protein SAMN05421748_103163 [Actinoplanes atraurantiacus]